MLDFTSSLYLGLRHASATLAPWRSLTGGRPASLAETDGASRAAAALARLAGCEAGTLVPSTLHLFWDLFAGMPRRSQFFVDAGAYPIARWGVERAVARGARSVTFAHFDAAALHRRLEACAPGALPVVVVDGFCPACARPAPLAQLLRVVRAHGGRLVIDDTQALGLAGPHGGGSLRTANLQGDDVLLAASLAKGFGVPAALLAGSRERIAEFQRRSLTRVHCSPVSVAVVRAAEHALAVNARHGAALRAVLARRVRQFRAALPAGCATRDSEFPVQTLRCAGADALRMHRALLERGVRTVLHGGRVPRLSFIITARHGAADIDAAARAVVDSTLCVRSDR
jgi:8-amino-7-oxononanoate synthase